MSTFHDKVKATGKVTFQLFDKDGNLKEEKVVKNLVVTDGLNWIAARMKETGRPDQMSHMAIGTSSTIPSVGQQDLLGFLTPRVALTVAGGTVADSKVTYTATFPGGGTGIVGAIQEAGIFNASTNGTMLCRTTFDVISKTADDSLGVTWEITIN